MRGFVPTGGSSGHDHFFDTFAKFGGSAASHRRMARRSGHPRRPPERAVPRTDGNAGVHATAAIAKEVGWNDDFGQLRDRAAGARPARRCRRGARALRRSRSRALPLRTLRSAGAKAPACSVEIRYIYQVLRGFPKEQVFAQTLLGFEVASADPRFVGINYVHAGGRHDFHGRLRPAHADRRLPARPLSQGAHQPARRRTRRRAWFRPKGLCCHIRLAVEEAHAERIGHGVDVMYEDRPYDLLKEMAAKHVMVEINLTSNDVILGIAGKDHPFPDLSQIRRSRGALDRRRRRLAHRSHARIRPRRGDLRPALCGSEADGSHQPRTRFPSRARVCGAIRTLSRAPPRPVPRTRPARTNLRGMRGFSEVERKSAAAVGTRAPLPRLRIQQLRVSL